MSSVATECEHRTKLVLGFKLVKVIHLFSIFTQVRRIELGSDPSSWEEIPSGWHICQPRRKMLHLLLFSQALFTTFLTRRFSFCRWLWVGRVINQWSGALPFILKKGRKGEENFRCANNGLWIDWQRFCLFLRPSSWHRCPGIGTPTSCLPGHGL